MYAAKKIGFEKKFSLLYAAAYALLLFFLYAPNVIAQQGFQNPIATNDLDVFLRQILEAVILIAFPVIVLFLVYSGFLFISAQGNPEKLSQAKRMFIWALVGALIVLGGQALSFAIENTANQILP